MWDLVPKTKKIQALVLNQMYQTIVATKSLANTYIMVLVTHN